MTQAPGIERLALPDPARDIFLRTCLILDEHVTPHTPRAEGWRIGGGTILAARWRHRKSNDIDLLVEPGTETAFFRPASNPELTRLLTDVGATSLDFDRLSEIRFPTTRIEILAARPTPRLGHKNAIVDGHPATALASSQILTAKMLNRSLQPPVRDLYDFAIAERMDPRALAIAVNSLTPTEIMTRLLRWEVSKHDYAGDARIDIQDVPERYREIQEKPAEHAIRAIQATVYHRVRIRAGRKRATVHTESHVDLPDRTYDTVEQLETGFEKDGINVLSSASGFNPDSVRARTIEAMRGDRTVTVLELHPERRTRVQPPQP